MDNNFFLWFMTYSKEYIGEQKYFETISALRRTCSFLNGVKNIYNEDCLTRDFKRMFHCPHWTPKTESVCESCLQEFESIISDNAAVISKYASRITEMRLKRNNLERQMEVYSERMSTLEHALSAQTAYDNFKIDIAKRYDDGAITKLNKRRASRKAYRFYMDNLRISERAEALEDKIRTKLHKSVGSIMKTLFNALVSKKKMDKWWIGQSVGIPIHYMRVKKYMDEGVIRVAKMNTMHVVNTAFKIRKNLLRGVHLERDYFD